MNYLFLDNGFEEIEAITTIDLLRRANIALTTVSITGSELVLGAHNIAVKLILVTQRHLSYQVVLLN